MMEIDQSLLRAPSHWMLPQVEGALRTNRYGPVAPRSLRVWKENVTGGMDRFGGYWASEPYIWVISNGGTFYHFAVTETALEAVLEAGVDVELYRADIQDWLRNLYAELKADEDFWQLDAEKASVLKRMHRLSW